MGVDGWSTRNEGHPRKFRNNGELKARSIYPLAAFLPTGNWADGIGNLYLWGGYNSDSAISFSDVWKYNTCDNEWTLVAGDTTINSPGNYTSYCTYSGSSGPASRYEHKAPMTLGYKSAFYTFGGYYFASINEGVLNDLWQFDNQLMQWKWISGNNNPFDAGNYGALEVASASNLPPARFGQCSWVDSSGVFWMWGGRGGSAWGQLNDMWMFVPDTSCVHIPIVAAVGGSINYTLSDSLICNGDTAIITLSGGSNYNIWPAQFSWINSNQAALYPDSTTTFIITCQAACGGIDTVRPLITVNPPLQVNVTSDQAVICSTDSAHLCATARASNPIIGMWAILRCVSTVQYPDNIMLL